MIIIFVDIFRKVLSFLRIKVFPLVKILILYRGYETQTLTQHVCLFVLTISVFAQKLNLDTTFTPTTDGHITQLELLSDGKMMIAGSFVNVNGVTRARIARLNADGSLDQSFDANAAPTAGSGYGFNYSMQTTERGRKYL